MSKRTKVQQTERDEAIAKLREWLKPGDTVYTILRHVSASGMSREIGMGLLSCEGGRAVDLHPNWLVSTALGERVGKRDGIIVSGAGMDMGFHLVYNLGRVLWPAGYPCSGETCRSNDHSNDYTCRREVDAHHHRDGGYALAHRWL